MKRAAGPSFATEVREELLHIAPRHALCRTAQMCSIVQVCGSLIVANGQLRLRVATENATLARMLYTAIRDATGERVELLAKENKKLSRRDTVFLDLSGRDTVLSFLAHLGILRDGCLMRTMPAQFRRLCCKRAYLRGLFLASGSVNSPEKAYHMEWVFREEEMAQSTQALLAELGIEAQMGHRKNQHVVYLKDGEGISRVLAQMGAHNALFAMENARILHEVKNNVNRSVNCETANVKKTVDASMRQVACIEYLAKTGKLATLSAGLRQAADARLTNPQASLIELAAAVGPQTTKSGMNHRLRRLVELAEQSGYIGDIRG